MRSAAERAARSMRVGFLSAALGLLLAITSGTEARDDPGLPNLEDLEQRAPSREEQPTERALRMPGRVTICVDRGGRRCWSVAGESDCRDGGGSGEVFGRVANTESGDAGEVLVGCWAEVRGDRVK